MYSCSWDCTGPTPWITAPNTSVSEPIKTHGPQMYSRSIREPCLYTGIEHGEGAKAFSAQIKRNRDVEDFCWRKKWGQGGNFRNNLFMLKERGIEVFNTSKAYLEACGIWNEVDTVMLEMYCFTVERSEKLAEDIQKEGATIKYTNKGGFTNEAINPKLKIYLELSNLATKTASLFGLTPASRKKLKITTMQVSSKKGFNLKV